MVAPPAKDSAATAANAAALRAWLGSILAFQERSAGKPWSFYEELDAYLGPWGERGYLIAYGKKYCQRFVAPQALRDEALGLRWMERTLVLLQRELVGFVMQRYRAGTLASLSERELREFAFDSHARAYLAAGFIDMVWQKPAVLARVLYILSPELSPSTEYFRASVGQVLSTLRMLLPNARAGWT